MALKKNTADPTRSGTSTGKGKAKARQASPDPEEDANPPEPSHYEPPDLSNDDAPPVHAPPPKKESKRARKALLEREAKDDYAAFEARCHAQQVPASQEEIDRLLALQPPQIENLGPPHHGIRHWGLGPLQALEQVNGQSLVLSYNPKCRRGSRAQDQ